jgi:diguanylate cyclase
VLARVGGDEFAILLPHVDAEHAQAISKDLRNVTRASDIDLDDGTTLRLSASIGLALINHDTDNDEILSQADQAMYQDKTR